MAVPFAHVAPRARWLRKDVEVTSQARLQPHSSGLPAKGERHENGKDFASENMIYTHQRLVEPAHERQGLFLVLKYKHIAHIHHLHFRIILNIMNMNSNHASESGDVTRNILVSDHPWDNDFKKSFFFLFKVKFGHSGCLRYYFNIHETHAFMHLQALSLPYLMRLTKVSEASDSRPYSAPSCFFWSSFSI